MNRKELLVIVACFCGIGVCYGLQYSFSIFFVELTNYFHTTKAAGALIFSITLLVYGIYSPIIGILTNKYGGKRIFKVASFLVLAGLFFSSVSKSIYQLYFFTGVVTAVGMNSAGFVPSVIILTNYFNKKRGLALGIATTGVGAGAIGYSLLTKYLISRISWQHTMFFLGILSFILIFIVSYFLPEEKKDKKINFDFSFFKRKEFYLLQGGMACGAMTTHGVMLHIVSCFVEKGAKLSLAALTVSIIAFVGSMGKLLWGFLSDFFKPLTLYIFSCILIIISLNILLFSKTPVNPLIVFLFPAIFGLGYGSFAPLFPTLAYEIFKDDFGNIMGLLTMANGIGAFFSTYLMGYFYDLEGNYNIAIKFLIGLIMLSIIQFTLAFIIRKR